MPTVLITGGTGYIGSFTTLALLEKGYNVVVVDNLFNSGTEVLNRIELICGKRPQFYELNVTDEPALDNVFSKHPEIESVIHFAGLKALGMSSKDPLRFYDENVHGTMVVLRCMAQHNVRTLLFSSSSTIYGDVTDKSMVPVPEECPPAPVNVYGHTKIMGEIIITDFFNSKNREEQQSGSGKKWNAGLLRYFNPCGAHPSGIMGEDPRGGLHLIPVLAHIALGKIPKLSVWGGDYETRDGSMVRDYIHVSDLARGHLAALDHVQSVNPGVRAWNFGSGRGTSVLEALETFGEVAGRKLPCEVGPRRPEYVADLTASPERASKELKWTAIHSFRQACEDFWRWTTNAPEGYAQPPQEHLLKAMKA